MILKQKKINKWINKDVIFKKWTCENKINGSGLDLTSLSKSSQVFKTEKKVRRHRKEVKNMDSTCLALFFSAGCLFGVQEHYVVTLIETKSKFLFSLRKYWHIILWMHFIKDCSQELTDFNVMSEDFWLCNNFLETH